jgi:DNA polymerase III gamma/tau subunit
LIGYYCDILLYKTTGNSENLNTAVVDSLFKSLANRLDKTVIQNIIKELLECQSMLKWSNPKTSIEVTLVKITDIESAEAQSETIAEPKLHSSPIIDSLINQIGSLQEELRGLKTRISQNNQDVNKKAPSAREIKEVIEKKYCHMLQNLI